MRWLCILSTLYLLALQPGCSLVLDTGGKDCQSDQDCPSGLTCNPSTGLCAAASDGGADGSDAGQDAGVDAGDPGGDDCQQDCSGRVCGPDPVCAQSCGDCQSGQICDDAGQCLDALVLQGRTVGDASVVARVGDQQASTSVDSQGHFTLEIDPSDPDAVVILEATGGLGQEFIVLASVLADVGTLLERAGDDRELTWQEHAGVYVTPVTTARYAALYAANQGFEPAAKDSLIAAEQGINEFILGPEILYAAAVLSLIIDDPETDLPLSYTTTLELAQDIEQLRSIIAIYNETLPDPNAMQDETERLLHDPEMISSFTAENLPDRLIWLIKQRQGIIGYSSEYYDFADGGRGRYSMSPLRTTLELHQRTGFDWSFNEGVLLVTLDTPLWRGMPHYTTEQIAGLFPDDQTLQNQIRTALGEAGLGVSREAVAFELRRVSEGLTVDLLRVDTHWLLFLHDALMPHGIDVPDTIMKEPLDRVAWFDPSRLTYQPFTQAMVEGTWAMPVVGPIDLPGMSDEWQAGALTLAHARVVFSPNGTAQASGGGLENAVDLDWEILPDGRLQLGYQGGERQLLAIWEIQGIEYGLMVWHQPSSPDGNVHYARCVKYDPVFSFSEALLINVSGQFWQTTTNQVSFLPDLTGAYPLGRYFGFIFEDNGLLSKTMYTFEDYDLETNPQLLLEDYYNHVIQPQSASLELRFDLNFENRCDYGDPSCLSARTRTWEPVAVHEGLLYVMEKEAFHRIHYEFSGGSAQWNQAESAWYDSGGNLVDPDDQVYYWMPRLTAFIVADRH